MERRLVVARVDVVAAAAVVVIVGPPAIKTFKIETLKTAQVMPDPYLAANAEML